MATGKHSKAKENTNRKKAVVISACVVACLVVAAAVIFLPRLSNSRPGQTGGTFDNDLGTITVEEPEAEEPPVSPLIEIVMPNMAGSLIEALSPLADGKVYTAPDEMILQVEPVYQLPALPSGCEITSACALLVYRGIDVSPIELNGYLDQGWSNWNAHESFVGYCSGEGWMVYAEPVVAALNTYLSDNGITGYEAIDITGTEPESLYADYVARGIPVAVWVTTYLRQDRNLGDAWYIDGEYFYASERDHAMVLYGYTPDDVIFMDPLGDGYSQYPKESFENVYYEREMRAVAVVPTSSQES